jgi:glycosyltransferase involved in cell wall biosynthesis
VRIAYFADIRFPLERANGIQTAETCHALAARGHAVDLVVRPDTACPARDPFAYYALARDVPLRVVRVPAAGPAPVRRACYLLAALSAAMRPGRADVVFTRDLGVAAWIALVPRRWRPPLVYESHGLAAVVGRDLDALVSGARAASPRKQRRLQAREGRVWARADAYVAITAALAHDLESAFGHRPGLAVVPDGVRLPPSRQFVPPLDHDGAPLVVYAGHLYPWKGVDTLLDALALVSGLGARIVGGHPAEPDLDRLTARAAALGLSDRVTFTGQVAPGDVAAHLAAADVIVLPNSQSAISARYTSPLKLFEALAAGRAIVASNLSALAEVLTDGQNALLVAPDDAAALAAALARLVADPALARRLARAAYDAAPAYTWAKRAERLDAVLHAAVRT